MDWKLLIKDAKWKRYSGPEHRDKVIAALNKELHSKNVNFEKNFKELVETCRNEINRKNDQIKNLRSELDNVLYKRAAKNMNIRELETLMWKLSTTYENNSEIMCM